MRRESGLQKILYFLMGVLGMYILYMAGDIFLGTRWMQTLLEGGTVSGNLEDEAIRTWAPGYAAAVEEREEPVWIAEWNQQVVPVYSYLLESQDEKESNKIEEMEDTEAMTTEDLTVTFQSLLQEYFTVDSGTSADPDLINISTLLNTDLTLEKNREQPQILIYHTHAQEAFADSREGITEDTIIGVGDVLAEELRRYGYQVIHDTAAYDLVDGVLDRSAAYDYARESLAQWLEEYPTIEVIIDLHRDGVEGQRFVTEINGKQVSMIMFFNGISRDREDQPISYLPNPYTAQNLSFSFQLERLARELYPGFTRNIYLKAERYNLHFRARSLLIEAGTQLNTVEEEKNAMLPLADILNRVLAGTKTVDNSRELMIN